MHIYLIFYTLLFIFDPILNDSKKTANIKFFKGVKNL